MEFFPKYIRQTETKEPGDIVRAREDWNRLFNLLIAQGDHNTEAIAEIARDYATKIGLEEAIDAKLVEIGAGDMPKTIYDTNNNGIVDKAESVTDDSIGTTNVKDKAITRAKLEQTLQTLLTTLTNTATKVVSGKISNLAVASTEWGSVSGSTPSTNNYQTYNLGFTPKAVLIWNPYRWDEDYSTARYYGFTGMLFSYYSYREYSSRDRESNAWYGGLALTNTPQMAGTNEVFRIVSNGFRVHNYYYNDDDGDSDSLEINMTFGSSYYIAIG